jgi:hypothetical protein
MEQVKLRILAIQYDFAHLLNNVNHTVFKESTCVICYDDTLAPDTVFYPCSHQCCHYVCAQKLDTAGTTGTEGKCPLCRTTIRAKSKPSTPPVMPHPNPEKMNQQTVPLSVLLAERTLWQREKQAIIDQHKKTQQLQISKQNEETRKSLNALKFSVQELDQQINKHSNNHNNTNNNNILSDPPFSFGITFGGSAPASSSAAGAVLDDSRNLFRLGSQNNYSNEKILCPKLHRMQCMTHKPNDRYKTSYFCDVCKVEGQFHYSFYHCDLCTYDLCPRCVNIALSA